MYLIDRYIMRAHIAPFLFGFFTVVFLFLMQFIMRYLDTLVGKGLNELLIIQLILLNMAWMAVLAVPMGVLFSTLMAFGSLSAAHEVTIVKASGGSLIRMMAPVIISGALMSLGLFYFNDVILPESNHQAKLLLSDIQRKKPTFALESGKFSMDIEGYTIMTRKVDSISGALYGVTIYDFSKPRTRNIISADSGTIKFSSDYSKLLLNLKSGEVHQLIVNNVNNYKIIDFNEYLIAMNASGFAFERSSADMMSRGDRELRIVDMRKISADALENANAAKKRAEETIESHYAYLTGQGKYIEPSAADPGFIPRPMQRPTAAAPDKIRTYSSVQQRLAVLSSIVSSESVQQREYLRRVRQYEVEIQKKYAIPIACFLFVFVGCPLGIMTKGGNFGISAAISLGFYIVYWACLIGGEKLADRGLADPTISMWFGNLLIALMGILLTLKANNESLSFLGFGKIKGMLKNIKLNVKN